MPMKTLTDAELLRTIKAVAECGGTTGASHKLKLNESTVRRHIRIANQRGLHLDERPRKVSKEARPLSFPEFPSGQPEDDVLLDHMCRQFDRQHKAFLARKWFEVGVNMDGPIGIAWMGDPHVDSDGCNWPLLREHAAIMAETEGLFAANIGDTTDNWIGRLQRLYAHSGQSRETAVQLAEILISKLGIDWILLLRGNHDCLDDETECLTRRGWVRQEDIRETDDVYSLNPETNLGEWHRIQKIIRRPHQGEMVSIDTSGISLFCTPNHRVLHQRRQGHKAGFGDWAFAEAGQLTSGRVRIPRSALQNGAQGAPWTDDEIRLAAWVLTDGYLEERCGATYYRICQSKAGGIASIRCLLDELGLNYSFSERQRNTTEVCGKVLRAQPKAEGTFRISAKEGARLRPIIGDKSKLPAWVWDMTGGQFAIFLNALIDGDGCRYGDHRTGALLWGKKPFLDQVQALCHVNGWSATLKEERPGAWRLNIREKATADMDICLQHKVVTNFSGGVWCLTVPLGNFMVRRHGKAHFTGNCWAKSKPDDPLTWMQRGGAPMEDWQAQFKLRFPNGRKARIWAAHDFPGHSLWNPLHGPQRSAKTRAEADLYVCGHKHNYAMFSTQDADRGNVYWLARARGYKFIDMHAEVNGYASQSEGASIVSVFNPDATSPAGFLQCFADVGAAADFLTFLRRRWASNKRVAA